MPTAATALELLCPGCDDQPGAREQCATCGATGRLELIGCPLEMVDSATWGAMLAAELAESGSWPMPGGWLDQTQSCLLAVQRVWAERATIQARQAAER